MLGFFIALAGAVVLFFAVTKFFKSRVAKQEQMRAEMRARNIQSWKKLGFF